MPENKAPKKKKWLPSRQAVRHELRKKIWENLKGTDFAGELVAIRDGRGSPVIRRPAMSVMRDMHRQAFKRQFLEMAGRAK